VKRLPFAPRSAATSSGVASGHPLCGRPCGSSCCPPPSTCRSPWRWWSAAPPRPSPPSASCSGPWASTWSIASCSTRRHLVLGHRAAHAL